MTELIDERKGLPSASGMRRVDECTGSEALIAALRKEGKIGDDRPSPEATSGRKVHVVLADAAHKRATTAEGLTDNEIDVVKGCIEIKAKLIADWAGTVSDTFFNVIEQRFFYEKGGVQLFTGQPDFVAVDFKNLRAFVINYKSGRKEAMPATDNLQLRTEVVLVKHAYKELQEIDAAIVEPLVDWDAIRVRYSSTDLANAEANICAIVDNARTRPNERHAGDWCTYCPARVYCPEAQALAVSVVAYAAITPSKLPRGEAGAVFWAKLKLAKKLIDEFEHAYTEILEAEPDALPGYKLPEQGPLHWVVPFPELFRGAFVPDWLTNADIDGALTWNIGKLREVFGLKHRLKGVVLEEKFKQVAGESIKRRHGAPFIRPLTKKEKLFLSLKTGNLESDESVESTENEQTDDK